jgi:hypothetical protein
MAQLINTNMRIAAKVSEKNTEPVQPSKPSWWSTPWQRLEQEPLPGAPYVIPRPVSPLEFKEHADQDAYAIDFYGSRKKIDLHTGVEISGGDGNDPHDGVVGIMWSGDLVTLIRAVNYNGTKEEQILSSVAGMMSSVPEGRKLDLHTESEWLVAEMEKMRGHTDAEFSGDLSWEDVPHQWKKVLEYVSNGIVNRATQITSKDENIQSLQDIMVLYMGEVIEKAEETRPDATPDETPWF